jgi:hypothetical protein
LKGSREFASFIDSSHASQVIKHDLVAALAKILPQCLLHSAKHLLVGHLRLARIGRQLEERAQQHDALHAHLQVGLAGHLAGDLHHIDVVEPRTFV